MVTRWNTEENMLNLIFRNKNKNKLLSGSSKYETIEILGGRGGVGSVDHNEVRFFFFPANWVTWLYSTLFFSTNMDDSTMNAR